MATSWTQIVVCGWQVDPEFVMEQVHRPGGFRCGHPETLAVDDAAYCPRCGQRKSLPSSYSRIRDSFEALLLPFCDVDDLCDVLSNGTACLAEGFMPEGLDMRRYQTGSHEKVDIVLVGATLFEFDRQDGEVHEIVSKGAVVMPTRFEFEILEAMHARDLPPLPGSYGLHFVQVSW